MSEDLCPIFFRRRTHDMSPRRGGKTKHACLYRVARPEGGVDRNPVQTMCVEMSPS